MKSNLTQLSSTLTHRYAAIQIKMWHLQFRMREIHDAQARILSEPQKKDYRQRIKQLGPAHFRVIDMLIAFEHLSTLMSDILSTEEIRDRLSAEQKKRIGQTKDVASRWIAIRNRLGGHIDINVVTSMCEKHNFSGTLLSSDLEADMVLYQLLVLEGAVNAARANSDIFGRDLDFSINITSELEILMNKLNQDWEFCFGYFEPFIREIYKLGKKEKINATTVNDRQGIIVD